MAEERATCPRCGGKIDHYAVERTPFEHEWHPFCPACGFNDDRTGAGDPLRACPDCGEQRQDEWVGYPILICITNGCPSNPYPTVYRCSCGQFYSSHTADKHKVCQMIEDEKASGYVG